MGSGGHRDGAAGIRGCKKATRRGSERCSGDVGGVSARGRWGGSGGGGLWERPYPEESGVLLLPVVLLGRVLPGDAEERPLAVLPAQPRVAAAVDLRDQPLLQPHGRPRLRHPGSGPARPHRPRERVAALKAKARRDPAFHFPFPDAAFGSLPPRDPGPRGGHSAPGAVPGHAGTPRFPQCPEAVLGLVTLSCP